MKIHDPMHVAQLASVLLSSQLDPEKHHIKKAVQAARIVLDEAFSRAEEDEANAEAAAKAAAEEAAPAEPSTEKIEA